MDFQSALPHRGGAPADHAHLQRARVRDVTPGQIVPILAGLGPYIGSERSFYRVLHAHDQAHQVCLCLDV